MPKKKLRKTGDILLDMEPYLEELVDDHDLQWYDILFLILGWLTVHRVEARETYEGSNEHPVFYYGPKEGLK